MNLSQLEEDFMGDLEQDFHDIWELYQFVRLWHKDASEEEVLRVGNHLIESWAHRNWLVGYIVPEYISRDFQKQLIGEELIAEVKKLGASAADPKVALIVLELTPEGKKAFQGPKIIQ